jgi:hypothetical protein
MSEMKLYNKVKKELSIFYQQNLYAQDIGSAVIFVSVSAKIGSCIVGGRNGRLVETKIRTFKWQVLILTLTSVDKGQISHA